MTEIANKYNKGVGQVILRWDVQRGIIPLSKSTHKSRMEENISIFDFELSDNDMQKIASLDKEESQFFDHRDPEAIKRLINLH